jgi:predicted tellurium resistance membrane protein TerC
METLNAMMDFSWINNPAAWIGLLTLVALEVVLGIDNIVFISILSGKLPAAQQAKARQQGLILAVIPRIVFLFFIGFILQMQEPLFHLKLSDTLWIPDPKHPGQALGINGQEIVLIVGGLFLLVQAVREIHHAMEPEDLNMQPGADLKVGAKMGAVLVQIMLMNIIFSLDSIVTAIGMVKELPVMVLAVMISTVIMIFAIGPIGSFVQRHPTVKMLALAFLLLIGTNLLGEAFHFHIPKGYVYFAMAFSVFVEMLNIKAKRSQAKLAQAAPEVQ